MATQIDFNNVDRDALNLSRAIGLKEGGGKMLYDNYSGDAGTSAGAYQWNNGKVPLKKGEIPANFKNWAIEYGLNPNDFSPENQDKLAYARVKDRKDKGYQPFEIAAEHNAGNKDAWKDHVGDVVINGKKIHYDTPSYVKGVKNYYDKLSGGNSQQNLTKDTVIKTAEQEKPNVYTGPMGTNPNDTAYGNLIDNAITRGITKVGDFLTFGGASQLGGELGTGLAKDVELAKGAMGGQSNAQYIPDMNYGNTVAGLGKTVAGTLSTAALPSLAKSLLGSGSALESSSLSKILGKTATTEMKTMGASQKAEVLADFLRGTSNPGEKVLLQKALQELEPAIMKEQGLIPGLARRALSKGKGLLLGGAKSLPGLAGLNYFTGNPLGYIYENYLKPKL